MLLNARDLALYHALRVTFGARDKVRIVFLLKAV